MYFVLPLGLLANGVGYSKHGNVAVALSSLLGMACVAAAVTVKRLVSRRNWINAIGCVLMLAASYRGRQLESKLQVQGGKRSSQCCSQQGCSDK